MCTKVYIVFLAVSGDSPTGFRWNTAGASMAVKDISAGFGIVAHNRRILAYSGSFSGITIVFES